MDSSKAKEALMSFNAAFGGIIDFNAVTLVSNTLVIPYPETSKDRNIGHDGDKLSQFQLEEALHKIEFYVKSNSLVEGAAAKFNKEGNIEISLKDGVLFDSGQALIKSRAKPILKKLGTIIKTMDNQVIIEGHTDNVPIISAKYRSNWELSSARALAVSKYFIENTHFSPKKISIQGFGEYKPVSSNATIAGKSKNRRVTIVVVKKRISELY
jgi:chemotaxis protein MotB